MSRTALDQDMTLDASQFNNIAQAYVYVRDQLDLAGRTVTINVGNTSMAVLEGAPTGYGSIVFRGANGHPGETKCRFYLADGAQAMFTNMTLESPEDGIAVSRGIAWVGNVWIGQCSVGLHAVGSQSLIRGVGPITTLHGTRSRIQFNTENGANIELPVELRISGGPTWDNYVQADGGSIIDLAGASFFKAAENGNSVGVYDFGVVRLDPRHTLKDMPGNGRIDSDRADARVA